MTRTVVLLLALALVALSLPSSADARRPRRLSLDKLVRYTLSSRSTMLSLARYLGHRVRKAEQVSFTQDQDLERGHPALASALATSTGGAPGPSSWAVLSSEARIGKQRVTAWIATDAALLKKPKVLSRLVVSRRAPLVLLITVDKPSREAGLSAATVERIMRRLGSRVSITGRLGKCEPSTSWCYLQTYFVKPRRRRREGSVVLELSRPATERGSRVRGIKIVRYPPAGK